MAVAAISGRVRGRQPPTWPQKRVLRASWEDDFCARSFGWASCPIRTRNEARADKSEGMQSMPLGDASGSVEVANLEHVDLVGTEVPVLVFVLSVAENPDQRRDLVVCDSGGASCTKRSTLDRIFSRRSDAWEAPSGASGANEARGYTFRRHPRGVLVMTTGEPRCPTACSRSRSLRSASPGPVPQ